MDSPDFTTHAERFTGAGDSYDAFRPSPPEPLAEWLIRLLPSSDPEHVVDLGCGTGLSTRYWQGRPGRVTGVEPNDDMRRMAESRSLPGVFYLKGFSHATGLPDGCADIVTCAQSLHWMDPQATFREAARLLKEGGVFAAYDYDWPPLTSSWEIDAAYRECFLIAKELEASRNPNDLARWDKEGHLQRMRDSGRFRHVREFLLHHEERGNGPRILGLPRSQNSIVALLEAGVTEEELGIDKLRRLAETHFPYREEKWLWSVRVRVGIR